MSEGLMKAMRGERRRARELQLKRQGYTPDEIGDRIEREFRSGGLTKRDLVDGLRQVMKEERELAAQEQARYADAYNRPEPVDGMKMSRADYEAELARRGLKLSVAGEVPGVRDLSTEGPARKSDPPVDASLAQQARQRAAEMKELVENPVNGRNLPVEKAAKRVEKYTGPNADWNLAPLGPAGGFRKPERPPDPGPRQPDRDPRAGEMVGERKLAQAKARAANEGRQLDARRLSPEALKALLKERGLTDNPWISTPV